MSPQPGRDGNPLDLIEFHETDLDNKKHRVAYNLRESPLDMLRAREQITGDQYQAGVIFRRDWEIASIGPDRAADLERLPQGVWADLSARQAEHLARINHALQRQNQRGRMLIIRVCAERQTFGHIKKITGWQQNYVSERFKEAIDDLAEHYGLKTRGKVNA